MGYLNFLINIFSIVVINLKLKNGVSIKKLCFINVKKKFLP